MGIADDLLNNLNGNNNVAGTGSSGDLPWETEASNSQKLPQVHSQKNDKPGKGTGSLLSRIDLSSNKTKLAIGAIVLLLFVGGYSVFNMVNSQKSVKVESSTAEETKQAAEITVHVGGAVKNPGVYKLNSTQRLMDAVNMAGGLTSDADSDQVNLAKVLEDGEQIIIPSKSTSQSGNSSSSNGGSDSSGSSSSNSGSSSSTQSGKVNINTADLTTLQTLSGVGPSTAQKIIDYRNANGKFKSIEEIKNVSGIGDKTYAKFADKICV